MTSLETFREILNDCQVEVPESDLEAFRDFVDGQADMILESWLDEKNEEETMLK